MDNRVLLGALSVGQTLPDDPRNGLARTGRGRLTRLALVLTALVALVAVGAGTVYVWPLRSDALQRATPETLSFESASARAAQAVTAEAADTEVLPECRSQFLSHQRVSAKAVLLLHGDTDCPQQYRGLAKLFFDRGYNVWVPRAPRHGVADRSAHAKLKADELVSSANDALNVAAGLGDTVGVVGISGGGVLATWLVGHRPDVVHRALLLSPLYKPNPARVPDLAVKPFTVLFGFGFGPDRVDGEGLSSAAMSQYLRIVGNFTTDPKSPHLRELAIVTSANDDIIDLRAATDIPRAIADLNDATFTAHELPRESGIGHDVLDPEGLRGRADEINQYYLDLYEGNERT
ncbi:alpha/beta fold hydrolase [Micromonospora sp. NPDC007208]|uniref:alpha/beta fold hydrolase n=1 Tax=Micromonospora sp. NPDC007208 TaxID=3364236 RepID=UPI0036A528A7